MDTFLDVSGIVKRAKQALNFKKDSELASYLGVSRATLSNWCARNRIDFHLLLNKMRPQLAAGWEGYPQTSNQVMQKRFSKR